MKTTLKRIITVILCAVLAITSTGINTAYAAQKLPLKVTFNGKSATLSKDLTADDRGTVKIKTVKTKWGAPKKEKNGGYIYYTWKKGKASIQIGDDNGYIGSIHIEINDKNASVYGVKVGMKKDAALKKLKNATGIKTVKSISDDDYEWMNEKGIYNGSESIIVNSATYMPISFSLKNGKVSSIYWMRS